MSSAIYPGSFDPFTLGHLDVATRALCCFDRLIIGVVDRPGAMFSTQERVKFIKDVFSDPRVEVKSFDTLLVNFLKTLEVGVVVRGIRSSRDFDYEMSMAQMNQVLSANVQTVFIPASPQRGMISSSLVKEVLAQGGDISQFVPSSVCQALQSR